MGKNIRRIDDSNRQVGLIYYYIFYTQQFFTKKKVNVLTETITRDMFGEHGRDLLRKAL